MWDNLDRIIEIVGAAIGLVYLYLEYKASIYLWVVGIIMPAIYIYVFWQSGLYADFGISVYYVLAGIYGLVMWLRSGRREDGEFVITRTPRRQILPLVLATAISFVVIAWILVNFTDSTVPYADSFTTALGIVGLWMLSRKQAEQWLVWVVADMLSAALYIYKDLYPTAGLYMLYTVVAVFGYRKWVKMSKENETSDTAH